MRITPTSASGTWATFLRDGRARLRLSQEAYGALVGLDRSTIWRQENRDQKPDTFAQASKMVDALGGDRDPELRAEGMRLAGFADAEVRTPSAEPELWTYARSLGLDPRDDNVHDILTFGWSKTTAEYMLREERRVQEEDRRRRRERIRLAQEMYEQRDDEDGVDQAAG